MLDWLNNLMHNNILTNPRGNKTMAELPVIDNIFTVLRTVLDSQYKNEKQALKNEVVVITHRIVRSVLMQNETQFYNAFAGATYKISELPGGDFLLEYGDVITPSPDQNA